MAGTVKWFNDAKGFGLLLPMMAAKICSHTFSAINMSGFKSLKEGQRSPLIDTRPKGKQASISGSLIGSCVGKKARHENAGFFVGIWPAAPGCATNAGSGFTRRFFYWHNQSH